jgi:hypothetical protein
MNVIYTVDGRSDNMDNTDNTKSLGEIDTYLVDLENLITEKRNALIKKQNELNRNRKENHYLEGVFQDYNKYFGYIRNQKMEQIRVMEVLKRYLSDIIINEKLSEHDMIEIKKERDEVVRSIRDIKAELDKIILK